MHAHAQSNAQCPHVTLNESVNYQLVSYSAVIVSSFNKQQQSSLEGQIEASLMLQYTIFIYSMLFNVSII